MGKLAKNDPRDIDIGGVRLTQTGLVVTRQNISWDEWLSVGAFIQRAEGAVNWWLGDWTEGGSHRFGEKFSQAMELTGFSYEYLCKVCAVSRKFAFTEKTTSITGDSFRRFSELTWKHHLIVSECRRLDTPELRHEWLQRAVDEDWSANELARQLKVVHVGNNSGCEEWYTPEVYVNSVRKVLGAIDLDPATSTVAQEWVKAKTFYTAEDDGLSQDWRGRVFMNPPYTSGLVDKFMEKLRDHHIGGDVPQAITLTNNATETGWFQESGQVATAMCFPKGRIKYLDESGEPANSPLQGQVFMYFGSDTDNFVSQFRQFGRCVTCPES